MKSSDSIFFKKKQTNNKSELHLCSEKDKKINRVEATLWKMEAEIGRLSSVIGNGEYVCKFYIASNFN